jgi:energy-coupling factor transport system ATP-binding protein
LNSSIVVEDLHFAYNKGEEVLKGISLVFDRRSTAIIGQNGAGKTTFAKLLKGLLKPDSGSISIKGIDTKNTTAAGLSRHIGLIFQNPNDQIFKSNVLDEVMFGPLNIMKEEKRARDLALARPGESRPGK